jgi:hypothetical protein
VQQQWHLFSATVKALCVDVPITLYQGVSNRKDFMRVFALYWFSQSNSQYSHRKGFVVEDDGPSALYESSGPYVLYYCWDDGADIRTDNRRI